MGPGILYRTARASGASGRLGGAAVETRANYLLIGAFTLVGIIGAFAFLLWLAKVEVDRQYAYYFVKFDNVAGLGDAGDVRYNGLPVGQVVGLELDPDDPSKVRVQIEVSAETPVKTDTVATLQSQGVTGVSYVALSGGTPEAERVALNGVIPSERSALQSVFEGAPELLERAIALLEDINDVVNEDNKAAVSDVLANLASASGRLDGVLADFEGLSGDLSAAAREIAAFTDTLEGLSATAGVTLETATDTFSAATETLNSIDETAKTVTEATQTELPGLIADIRQTAQTANRVIDEVGADVTQAVKRLDGLVTTGTTTLNTATETLTGIQSTFAAANTTLAGIDTAMAAAEGTLEAAGTTFSTVNRVLEEDLDGLVTDVRRAATALAVTAEEDLPVLMTDLRETASTATRVLDQAGKDITQISTQFDGIATDGTIAINAITETMADASTTLASANETLTAITDAADLADQTLIAAEKTFTSVNAVIDEDLTDVVADVRKATDAFTTSVLNASDDIDAISTEVLAASKSASNFIGTLEGILEQNQRQVSDFVRLGLPEFLRFTEESRLLIRNLERLVTRVERDPARFLLGTQNSEFRR